MLKVCDGYGFLDLNSQKYTDELYTSSDIKGIVKEQIKEGHDIHYVDVIQNGYVLVAMDANGNGFYLPK